MRAGGPGCTLLSTWLFTLCFLCSTPLSFSPNWRLIKYLCACSSSGRPPGLNILGIVPVGKVSLLLSVAVLTPFLVLILCFFSSSYRGARLLPSPSIKGILPSHRWGWHCTLVMWNCLGWDNVTTYAEEVEKPVRSYLISIFIAFALVLVVYFFTILVAQQSHINFKVLTEQGFPALGELD